MVILLAYFKFLGMVFGGCLVVLGVGALIWGIATKHRAGVLVGIIGGLVAIIGVVDIIGTQQLDEIYAKDKVETYFITSIRASSLETYLKYGQCEVPWWVKIPTGDRSNPEVVESFRAYKEIFRKYLPNDSLDKDWTLYYNEVAARVLYDNLVVRKASDKETQK